MSSRESTVQKHIRLAAQADGVLLLRQNSGALMDKTGRLVRFGLANESKAMNENMKSGDLIGITPLVITQDMVGKTVGVFTSVECKEAGWVQPRTKRELAQERWATWVRIYGGFAGFAASIEDAKKIWGK